MRKRSKWEDDSDDDQGEAHAAPARASASACATASAVHVTDRSIGAFNAAQALYTDPAVIQSYHAGDDESAAPAEQAPSCASDSPPLPAQAQAALCAAEAAAPAVADTMELDLPDDAVDAAMSASGGKVQLYSCRLVDSAYERLNAINEGAYGVVFRARNLHTREIVALKQIKMLKCMEGFPITTLREVSLLLQLKHEKILDVHEVVVSPKGQVFKVSEFVDNDLRALL